jgi:hypothetical protein
MSSCPSFLRTTLSFYTRLLGLMSPHRVAMFPLSVITLSWPRFLPRGDGMPHCLKIIMFKQSSLNVLRSVRGSPLAVIKIHNRLKRVHVLGVPKGCKTPTLKYDVMFVCQVVFSGITLESLVDQAVTIRSHCRIHI